MDRRLGARSLSALEGVVLHDRERLPPFLTDVLTSPLRAPGWSPSQCGRSPCDGGAPGGEPGSFDGAVFLPVGPLCVGGRRGDSARACCCWWRHCHRAAPQYALDTAASSDDAIHQVRHRGGWSPRAPRGVVAPGRFREPRPQVQPPPYTAARLPTAVPPCTQVGASSTGQTIAPEESGAPFSSGSTSPPGPDRHSSAGGCG